MLPPKHDVDGFGAPRPGASPVFATTRWSVVLRARDEGADESARALEQLCREYWYPIYAFARRQGHAPADAEDLTQGFFLLFLERAFVRKVDPGKGKFRTYLLSAFKNYLIDEHHRAAAEKRGGGRRLLSLDQPEPEDRYRLEAVDTMDPQRQYETSWAMTLLELVLRTLGREFEEADKGALFADLKAHLLAEPTAETYEAIGRRHGLSESAVTNVVYRMRKRYKEIFRQTVLDTLDEPSEFEAEMHSLLTILGGG